MVDYKRGKEERKYVWGWEVWIVRKVIMKGHTWKMMFEQRPKGNDRAGPYGFTWEEHSQKSCSKCKACVWNMPSICNQQQRSYCNCSKVSKERVLWQGLRGRIKNYLILEKWAKMIDNIKSTFCPFLNYSILIVKLQSFSSLNAVGCRMIVY